MWEKLWGYIPSGMIIACAVLSFLIPWSVYKVNQMLHKHSDPPWKREENK